MRNLPRLFSVSGDSFPAYKIGVYAVGGQLVDGTYSPKTIMKKWMDEARLKNSMNFLCKVCIPPHGASFQVGNFRVTTLHAYGTKFLSNVQHVLPHIFQILMVLEVFNSRILRWRTRKISKFCEIFPRRFVLFWRKKLRNFEPQNFVLKQLNKKKTETSNLRNIFEIRWFNEKMKNKPFLTISFNFTFYCYAL